MIALYFSQIWYSLLQFGPLKSENYCQEIYINQVPSE